MSQHHLSNSAQRTLNQQRLIDQNKKLNEEVLKLESQVSKVISDNVIEAYERRHSQKSTKREELSLQAGYMKKLKNKLAQMKGLKSYDRRRMSAGRRTMFIRRRKSSMPTKQKKNSCRKCSFRKNKPWTSTGHLRALRFKLKPNSPRCTRKTGH